MLAGFKVCGGSSHYQLHSGLDKRSPLCSSLPWKPDHPSLVNSRATLISSVNIFCDSDLEVTSFNCALFVSIIWHFSLLDIILGRGMFHPPH